MAIPTLKGNRLNHVIDLCVSTHCAVQMLSDPQLVGAGTPQQGAFRELNTADFLSREEVTLDTEKISGYLTGKTVLVTGGGGSIGSELCRQVMRFKPAKLLIFDIYENCAYELLMELQQKYGRDVPVTVLVGSIRDKARLDEVFETYHPTVVFHAAAHKHVPLMEISPAMYGAYHHITVLGKEDAPHDHKYDVVGGLCENNDKFAIDRMLPKIDIGDIVYIHDTGAHGSAMGYNYNGKLRSAEVLLCEDGTHRLIRRAETPRDYFATLDFLPFMKPLLGEYNDD